MKHIKEYESNNEISNDDFKAELKHYLVWYNSNKKTRILEALKDLEASRDNGEPCCRVKYLYKYYIETKELFDESNKDIDKNLSIDRPTVLDRLLYQSDNLQDCIDMLPILSITNNYNL